MTSHSLLIEKFARVFEEEGLPRIAGRLIGFLMLNEGPFTLDEISEQLQISKTSASTNTRMLAQLGAVEHVTRPGDRRDYYELAADHAERKFEMVKRRMDRFYSLLCDAVDAMPAENESQLAKLSEMKRFYEFLVGDLEDRLEQWRSLKLVK
jgi:DNA-binding transcriptional regulator GbsR (MarR family)